VTVHASTFRKLVVWPVASGAELGRELFRSALEGSAAVSHALAEQRSVVRTACLAAEGASRTAMRVTEKVAGEGAVAWREVPVVGGVVAVGIQMGAAGAVAVLGLCSEGLKALDILMSTVRSQKIRK
jgi:hypothetical protein